MATGGACVALVALGALLVWTAYRGARGSAARQAAATPLGLTGGVCVLAGVAVGVSGLDTVPGLIALVVAGLVLVVGSVVTVTVARGAARA